MSANQFIDAHSHLLPGIDDGCRSVEDSLACVQKLLDHGFTGTICTPHVCVVEYPGNTPRAISNHVERLRRELATAGLDYTIWPGAEVRVAETTVSWFEQHGVPTLGAGRCVLIDYWEEEWLPSCDDVVSYLFANDYQPILAHPERMQLDDDELEKLLSRLQRQGVWLQGNLRCIAGVEGDSRRSRMLRWLRDGRYALIATDLHRPECLDARLRGIAIVDRVVGNAEVLRLLNEQINEMLVIQSVTPQAQAEDDHA